MLQWMSHSQAEHPLARLKVVVPRGLQNKASLELLPNAGAPKHGLRADLGMAGKFEPKSEEQRAGPAAVTNTKVAFPEPLHFCSSK